MDVEDRVLNPKALTLSQNVISMENIRDLKHCHNHVLCRPHINTHNTFHRNLNNSIFYPRKLLKSKFMNDAIVTHYFIRSFSLSFSFSLSVTLSLYFSALLNALFQWTQRQKIAKRCQQLCIYMENPMNGTGKICHTITLLTSNTKVKHKIKKPKKNTFI